MLTCLILQGFEWAFRKSYPTKIPGMVQGGGGLLASQGLIWSLSSRFLALVQALGVSPLIGWHIELSSRFIALDQAFVVGQSGGWYIRRQSNRFLALCQVFDISPSTGWYFVSYQPVGIECLSSRFLTRHLVLANSFAYSLSIRFLALGHSFTVSPSTCWYIESKKISNDQELIQSDPISCPQNQKGK